MKLIRLHSIITFSIFALALTSAQAKQVQAEKMDRIIAVVDQAVLTEQELNDRIRTITAQLEKKGTELPPQEVLNKQVLERLIVDSLLLQFASQTGVKVDDPQLDNTIMRIAEQNKLTLPEFKKALENDGVSFRKFREDMRNEIIISRLREREVENRVTVSEGEIDNYLTTQASRAGEQDEFQISHILIRTPEDSSPEDIEKARTKVEQLYKSLQEGMSFNEASSRYSDAENALDGGNLGWRSANQIPPAFFEMLSAMQVAEVSKPIRSPSGIHILKLNDRRTSNSSLVVEQTHVRHILLKLNEVTSEKEAKHKMDTIKERLDNGTKFEEMARQYSEDGSASSGGDLGWVNPGDTVPAFEKAMTQLGLGEISEPVRSPFGWHIIQVIERRKQDMAKEAARLKARQEILARKAEEAYTDWIRELRDKAFVELRLEDKF